MSEKTSENGEKNAQDKILYVITRADRGGAQIHVKDILANLPINLQPVLVTGEEGVLCDEVRAMDIPVKIVPALKRNVDPVKDFLALIQLVKLILAERPALVHLHTSKAGLLGRIACALTGTPAVFTAHTWSFEEGSSRLQQLVAIPFEWIAARISGKIITVSRANEKAALAKSLAEPSKILTIWNGMPDSPLRAKPGSRAVPVLVMVARFALQKDQRTLLMALAKVDLPWKLRFVGDGPSRHEVESLCRSLNMQDRVEFLGDRSDVGELLAASDLFILATKWEGFPLAILEAMRAGLPVISTDVGGCNEAITQGVTGFLTPLGDEVELAERIRELISSPELLKSMGKAGRERFDQDFLIEKMMERTLAVYASEVPDLKFAASLEALGARLQHKNVARPEGKSLIPELPSIHGALQ